ncbi:sialidase family protein [Conexibacter sp. JD483]|uniref:sialidase family protein n=1 Tax=unclassified Conexibacter TaxID=2627773 RepID=UPI00271BCE08|nr:MULTISPECIES: sialidase family protein [unclassified Conexibacter]MDO8187102.1 sialidase family protein [Conexibacter sp. CPCC 205706]MDO8200960.1 sialidase family protein [Conexibacter sp. CPCC 205762]MDR9371887.1 sialidase family protein [Conexibacter sp. JD483]
MRWDLRPLVVLDSTPAMFPGVTQTSDGLLVSFSTVPDGMPGGQVGVVRSRDGGRTWGEPTIVVEPADDDEAALTQVALRRLGDGTLLMPFCRLRIRGGYANRQATLHMARSEDDGETWELSDPLELDFLEPLTYGAVVETHPGRVLVPIWGREREGERWRSSVAVSDDGGRTWARGTTTIAYDPDARLRSAYAAPRANSLDASGEPLFDNIADPDFRPHADVDGFSETSVARLSDGLLVAILRQQGVGGDEALWLYRSESRDDGASWSAYERLDLTGMSPALHVLADDTLLLGHRVYAPDGGGARPATVVAHSHDGGRTWVDHVELIDPKGFRWTSEYQTGYPDFAELEDGSVLAVFYSLDPALGNQRYLAANLLRRDRDGGDASG